MKKLVYGFLTVLTIQGCGKTSVENASPTYREAFFLNEQGLQDFWDSSLPEGMVTLDSEWFFLGKDSLPGIKREIPLEISDEVINLPHRILAPNHSLWYRKEVNLQAGVLLLDADDGAQLWANGRRIPRSEDGEYFTISEDGTYSLTIRAVNNAMAGGLRRVTRISEVDFQGWKSKESQRRDSILVRRKTALLQDPGLRKEISANSWLDQKEFLNSFPILLTDPVVLLDTDQKQVVRWVSEIAGEAVVEFADGSREKVTSADGVFTFPLNPDRLRFKIYQEKSFFGEYSFPFLEQKQILKLALWGDSQGGWDVFNHLALLIKNQQVDLSIGAGDLVNNGSELYAYPRFLQKLSLMNAPQLPVPGNHDYDGFYEDLNPKLLKKYLFNPVQPTFGYQNLGVLSVLTLDPNEFFPVSIPASSEQYRLLQEVMESADWQNTPWKMIVLHQPPYSQGWPGYSGERSIRELLEPFFHRGLVDLVVAGHTHDYERLTLDFSGNPVHFFVVGGAGGGLEPEGDSSEFPVMDRLIKKHHFGILKLSADHLDWQVMGVEGELLDSLVVRRN